MSGSQARKAKRKCARSGHPEFKILYGLKVCRACGEIINPPKQLGEQ